MAIKITSTSFEEGGMIPEKYTCDGIDISPPLEWSNVPERSESLALICDDPDAPMGDWVHWVIFDMPATTTGLPENMPANKVLHNGARHGLNDFRKFGYGGPCPPSGIHRYFFKIFALDRKLELPSGSTKGDLLKAMKGHILSEGQLMGKYRR